MDFGSKRKVGHPVYTRVGTLDSVRVGNGTKMTTMTMTSEYTRGGHLGVRMHSMDGAGGLLLYLVGFKHRRMYFDEHLFHLCIKKLTFLLYAISITEGFIQAVHC